MREIRIVALICCLGLMARLNAQTVLISDDHLPQRKVESAFSTPRADQIDTLSFSASQPFFDDFSYEGPLPDSNLWYLGPDNLQAPTITRNLSVNPPTLGVATFDGINPANEVYSTSLSSGEVDVLQSHYINLFGRNASDNIKLSFFLQPQGRGNQPEATDFFRVFFTVAESNYSEEVYSISGSSLKEFQQVIIPVDKADYFYTQFQITFVSEGSRNGALDHWHLDYVFMGANRSVNDTSFQDLAPVQIEGSPFAPYTAVPLQHFNASQSPMKGFSVIYSNLNASAQNPDVEVSISDPIGGNILAGQISQQKSINIAPRTESSVGFSAFSNQGFSQAGSIEVLAEVSSANNQRNENDMLRVRFPVDSLFAYDDGEADAAFGLNQAFGFGTRFVLQEADTLEAIWIHFVPSIAYNPITTTATYLEDHSFRLMVWDDPHPDSILVQQIAGAKVNYDSVPNHFERYKLTVPAEVSDTFWVGIQQTDALAIGVGYDLNTDSDAITYWDSSGVWVNVNEGGTLMIRLEMKNGEGAGPAALEEISHKHAPRISIYPNPVLEKTIHFNNHISSPILRYSGRLINLQGQECFITESYSPASIPFVNLPANLPSGIYIWEHRIELTGGKREVFSEKVVLR